MIKSLTRPVSRKLHHPAGRYQPRPRAGRAERQAGPQPSNGCAPSRAAKPEKRFLTHQQVADLAEAAGSERLPILVLAYRGPRWGELAGLKVRRVDLMRRRLEIVEAVAEVRGRLLWDTPKNH